MAIREMSREECLQVLAGARLARLACAHENQPYVVPVYLAYHQPATGEACLYGFTTPGQKVQWMRDNPQVCVEVDEAEASDKWVSVIALGRYEELPEASENEVVCPRPQERPEQVSEATSTRSADSLDCQDDDEGWNDERDRAWPILKAHPVWWEPACTARAARPNRDPSEPFNSVFYRIRMERVTGHEATRDARDAIADARPATPVGRWGWLRRALNRVFGSRSKEVGSGS